MMGHKMRGGIEDNSKIIFLNTNICCDPSLEPSGLDGSNDGSQNMFLWRNMNISILSLLSLLIWNIA